MANRDDILSMFKRRNPEADPVLVENVMPVKVMALDDYKDEPMIFSPADGASIRVQKLHVLSQLIFDTVGPQGETGATGTPGIDGIDGDTIIVGDTVPTPGLGKDGDLYLNENTFNLFEKVSGAWHYLGRIKGDPGMGIQPMGEATCDEVNAIIAPSAGDVWIMLDAGVINDGSGGAPMDVIIGDWIGYGEVDANWMNLGQLEGPQGDTGPQGETANVTAGTTTTLAAGTDATVTSITTDNDVVLNFGIPQGVKGDQGDIGDTGPVSTTPGPTGSGGTTSVGTTTTLAAGEEATTSEGVGSIPTATILDFGIPQGIQGIQGIQGLGGVTAAGITTTLAPAADATITEGSGSTPESRVWDFGIPEGLQGTQGIQGVPGAGIYPQGEATVAEINALVADPGAGELWIMLDAGTVTYGSQPVDVIVDDWLGWGAEGYFVNMGQMQGIPGEDGTDGTTPTVSIGTVVGVPSGTAPTVVDSDPGVNVVLDFELEKGTTGDTGTAGTDGLAATVDVNPTVVKVAAGGTPTVTNTGDTTTAVFQFGVVTGDTGGQGAQGDPGTDGSAGADGYSPVVSIGTVGSVPAGTAPTVVDGDTGPDVLLNFTLEAGATGDIGPTGGAGGTGPAGPTAVSADVGNAASLGTDNLLFVGMSMDGTTLNITT